MDFDNVDAEGDFPMETVLTGWNDISELQFDAAAGTLTVRYRSDETRVVSSITQDGFDRFVGRTTPLANRPARVATSRSAVQ